MANQFVDLVIQQGKPNMAKKLTRDYRLCTLTRASDGKRYINLRVPESIQDTIINAYEEGKTVRIFA